MTTTGLPVIDDTEEGNGNDSSINDQVVELLTQSQHEQNAKERVDCLKQVQELIIHRDPSLLDNFLDEVLAFQSDVSVEVRQFIAVFLESACKQDPEVLSKTVVNLSMLLIDKNVNVQKKVMMTIEHLYQVVLKWVCKSRTVSDVMESTWDYYLTLKDKVLEMINSDNDGVRMRAIKFMEAVILLQSVRTVDSENEEPDLLSLDQVPRDHRFLSYRKLEADGKSVFNKMLNILTWQHVSGLNLMTCISALSKIARQRPNFYDKVIVSFETVLINLPPTLAKTQVTSLRKEMKKHLLLLLKHHHSADYVTQISSLLTDLGASQIEISKSVQKNEETRKRTADVAEVTAKKAKVDMDEDDEMAPEIIIGEKKKNSAIDITADVIYDGLNSASNVVDIVLLSMANLPDVIPFQFQTSYIPISSSGTINQIRHLARLLSAQMTVIGIGPGAKQMAIENEIDRLAGEAAASEEPSSSISPSHRGNTSAGIDDVGGSNANSISTAVSKTTSDGSSDKKHVFLPSGLQPTKSSKRMQQMGLAHITKPMSYDQLRNMSLAAFERILYAEKKALQGGAYPVYLKVLAGMVTHFNVVGLQDKFLNHIFQDQKSRGDLAVMWIYSEYAKYQGFCTGIKPDTEKGLERYDEVMTRLLQRLFDRGDHKESLFHRIFLEAPHITTSSLDLLCKACMDKVHGEFSLQCLKQLTLTRPRQRSDFITALLDFSTVDIVSIRTAVLEIASDLYKHPIAKCSVADHVSVQLSYLLESTPPEICFRPDNEKRKINPGKWDEDSIKSCLCLCLNLLPIDHCLIHKLAPVYVETSGDVKRVILRQLEIPVKAMGMQSPQILLLVQSCPPGAETLVTRIVHLLTERNPPTKELVDRIRELYHMRVPDVRFLIPVLTGLSKKEIIAALPKLIKLNTNVVKEVFNRLLHSQSVDIPSQPLSPTELLIALHQFDYSQSDMKAVLNAINLLISERQIYTQETLAIVIQQLLDQSPLATLLMRTVLQSLSLYPRLIGFVMNVLQRLIMKQVWKQPTVWEGFIKCCQKTRPQSFQVLLQLPPQQLKSVFMKCPELREPLLAHVNGLSSHQQGHITDNIMKVLNMDPLEYNEPILQSTSQSETMDDNASSVVVVSVVSDVVSVGQSQ